MTDGRGKDGPVYFESIIETIGRTPLVRLNRIAGAHKSLLLAKIESFNPGGSVKDRIGYNIVEAAERNGTLKPGGTIVESTSGNTGLGLALVAAVKGYKLICTIPDKQSREKINMLKALGAKVVVCPTNVAPESPDSYYEVAKRLVRETPNAILANQYHNPENPLSHYKTTGPEIWEQTAGRIDVLVGGVGTGGTMSGCARYLKEKNQKVRVIGADPEGSILKEYFDTKRIGEARPYAIEGIGEDIIPTTIHFQYFDEIRTVSDKDALAMTRRLSREEGILSGSSAGAALVVATQVAREAPAGSLIVVILPDTGERYLSKVHNDAWMQEQGFLDGDVVTLRDLVQAKRGRTPALITVAAGDPARRALVVMEEHGVSQLPVTEGGRLVGALSEGGLMARAFKNPRALDGACRDVMDAPFPRAGADETVQKAIDILASEGNALIVEESGAPIGIVTRFDVIRFAAR
jgi:cystathionine beta-synthase